MQKKSIKKNLPEHIAIIMDGNRRWSKKKGLSSLHGHKKGAEQFRKIATACREMGVKILTVYAFSTENWKRTEKEVGYLMNLLRFWLQKEKNFFKKENIKMNVIGRVEDLPKKLQLLIAEIVEETKNNKKQILNLAISYGGRQEILDAVKKIIKKKIKPALLTEEFFENYLYIAGQPEPDLLIRTGGEQRLSGFLTWQSVYSELYFSKKFWPDFSESDLKKAVKEFQSRKRRFGK